MAQTDYAVNQGIGFAGMLADVSFKRVASGLNKHTSPLPFGIAVKRGAAEGEFLPLSANTDRVEGIVLHSHDYDQRDLVGEQGVPVGSPMSVLTEGVVYVKVEDAVTAGGSVFARAVATAVQQAGALRGTADGNNTVAVKGAKYRRGAAAGGIAEVEFSKLVNQS